jgi:hypothetical protein
VADFGLKESGLNPVISIVSGISPNLSIQNSSGVGTAEKPSSRRRCKDRLHRYPIAIPSLRCQFGAIADGIEKFRMGEQKSPDGIDQGFAIS